MSKKLQNALIEMVFFMAGMLIMQSNVFGTTDTKSLSEKMKKVIEILEAE